MIGKGEGVYEGIESRSKKSGQSMKAVRCGRRKEAQVLTGAAGRKAWHRSSSKQAGGQTAGRHDQLGKLQRATLLPPSSATARGHKG